jgi:hypothetical protein
VAILAAIAILARPLNTLRYRKVGGLDLNAFAGMMRRLKRTGPEKVVDPGAARNRL